MSGIYHHCSVCFHCYLSEEDMRKCESQPIRGMNFPPNEEIPIEGTDIVVSRVYLDERHYPTKYVVVFPVGKKTVRGSVTPQKLKALVERHRQRHKT